MRRKSTRRPLADRFWEKVDKTDTCWLWTACVGNQGYGDFSIGRSKSTYAHRVAWELAYGPIPAGAWVLHRCDVRRCVRPDHLFLGDVAANNRDMYAKGRGWNQQPGVAPRGEKNPLSKITEAMVRDIRNAWANGETQVEIARQMGIHQTNVSMIVRRKTWTHV